MGAPNTAYQDIILDVDGDLHIAKELPEYLSAFGGIEGLFYLDKLVYIDNGTVKGFVGAVRIGGANEQMHADARKSSVVIEDDEGNEYVLLLDAGLNTLTLIETYLGVDGRLTEPPTALVITRSAYYLDTTQSLEVKVNSGAVQTINLPDVAENGYFENNENILGSLGDYVELRGKAENDEGIKYSAWQGLYVRPEEYYFRYSRVNNGDGTMTFTVQLFPIAFEVNLSVTFAQGYSGSGTISYCTVVVLAGQTTGTNNLTLVGTPLPTYSVSSYYPTQLSDGTIVDNRGELALKYHIHLTLSDYSSNNFAALYIEIRDDDDITPVSLPSAIDISLLISGDTQSGPYSETIPVDDVQQDFEDRELYLNYETGDTLSNVTMLATSTPPQVNGREILFTYHYI